MEQIDERTAQTPDAPALSELVNSAYRGDSSRRGWTTEADLLGGQRTDPACLAKTISTPNVVIRLFESHGALMGCVLLERKQNGAYLGMLTVRPEQQNAGWGRTILERAEAWVAREWQSAWIEMTVIQQRPELIAWYLRRGYHATNETRPFPYGDEKFGIPRVPDLKFVVLRKSLI